MKSSRSRSIILSIITLGLIAAFLYYLYLNADKYLDLLKISTSRVMFLFFLSLVFPLISGVINTYLFRGLGAKLPYRDGFFITAASTLANQLPISGGIVSKGFYLKRKYNLSYTKFFSATAALFLCFIVTNGLVGMAILLFWIFFKNEVVPPVLLIGFTLMVSGLFVFWLPIDRIKVPDRIYKRIHQAIEGWMLISRNPALLMKLLGLQSVLLVLLAIRYWLAFHMLSQNVTFGEVMLFSTASILTQLVSIAPGGLGVREAIVGAVASALGFDTGASVVAVGLDRLVSTFTILLIGGISIVILGKQISDLSVNTVEQKELT